MPHDHIIKFGKHEAFRTCIICIDIYAFTPQKRFQSTVVKAMHQTTTPKLLRRFIELLITFLEIMSHTKCPHKP